MGLVSVVYLLISGFLRIFTEDVAFILICVLGILVLASLTFHLSQQDALVYCINLCGSSM